MMEAGDWNDPGGHVIGMLIDGRASDDVDGRGARRTGETVLVVLNGAAGRASSRCRSRRTPAAGS
jgi:hypothetical protein